MTAPNPETDVREAARLADSGEAVLLDVREDDEWAAGRAPGAQHLALSSLTLSAVPTDRPILAVCRSGNRSGQVTEALTSRGMDVRNVTGGMKAWRAAGLPMVADGGAEPTVA